MPPTSAPTVKSNFLTKVKLGLRGGGLLLVAAALWFAGYRVTAPGRAVRLVRVETNAPAPTSGSLKVLCYNIAHSRGLAESNWGGNGPDARPARLREIAALLREAAADVVVLNEVDFDAVWSNHVNQARALARTAGYPYVMEVRNVDASLVVARLGFGNAVLSRYPLEDAAVIELPALSKWEAWLGGNKRGAVCTVRLPDGKGRVQVLPVHWDARNEDIRVRSAAVIGNFLKHSALPCIVAGDFNSTPVNYPHAEPTEDGETAISKLLAEGVLYDSGADRSQAPDLTFPSFAPTRTIDWILVSPDLRGRLREVRTLESRLSDHRPVAGVVEVTVRLPGTR